ncbi:unnamed protein product, partial [Ectocarpus fasciculatus]
MRAWRSCAVSMLASASYSARAFVPSASFRGTPLLSRSLLRRPVHSSSSCAGNGGVVPAHRRGVWVVQRRGEGPAGVWQQGGRVRLLTRMSSSGSSSSAQEPEGVDGDEQQQWSVTKVRQTFIDHFKSKRE